MALAQAGEQARGATVYTSLEPCAHVSARGPACTDLLVAAGVARVVAALRDPDPRTNGSGLARLGAAGVAVSTGVEAAAARRSMAGFLTRRAFGRPHVTLKLATSLDGCIALASGESRWITGLEARAHAHLERARHEAILVGRGTFEADAPKLDVRLAGLESRSPRRFVLGHEPFAPLASGWEWIDHPKAISGFTNVDHLLIEGGARTAAAFIAANLVDRLLLYRAPILIGGGLPGLANIGMTALTEAHGRWHRIDTRTLGSDTLEVYQRTRNEG
jgi:diaminohydroxyphosphoribosylaminopyrimidine deaminase/5-amino-6-(5-phosphoribosylamino)uracil reductase